MPKWFDQAFGAIAEGIGAGIGDARDRLVFEGFFGRHVPEPRASDGLGWTRDDRPERDSALDRAATPARDDDRGHDIER